MPPSPWLHRQPTLLPGRPIRPELIYGAWSAGGGFFMLLSFSLWSLYVVRDAGLNPFELIAVAVVLEFAVSALEIPTGVLADAVSRRLSVIAGMFISGAGWALIGLFPSFEGVVAGQFIWGVGYTFMSGAAEAWLADEVGEARAAQVYPQAAQWRHAAKVAGVLSGVGLGLLDARLPWVAGGFGQACLGALFLFTMTEAGWRPAPAGGRAPFAAIGAIGAIGAGALAEARRLPLVRAALGVSFLLGASSEMVGSLWGYHLIVNVGLPEAVDAVVLFGGIAIVTQVGALALVAAGRRATRHGSAASTARVLRIMYAAGAGASFAFAFAGVPGAAIALITVAGWVWAAQAPFLVVWVNRGLDPRTRATVLSSLDMTNSLGQVAQGPLSAGIVRLGSVQAALALGALLLMPAVGLMRTRPGEDRVARAKEEPAYGAGGAAIDDGE